MRHQPRPAVLARRPMRSRLSSNFMRQVRWPLRGSGPQTKGGQRRTDIRGGTKNEASLDSRAISSEVRARARDREIEWMDLVQSYAECIETQADKRDGENRTCMKAEKNCQGTHAEISEKVDSAEPLKEKSAKNLESIDQRTAQGIQPRYAAHEVFLHVMDDTIQLGFRAEHNTFVDGREIRKPCLDPLWRCSTTIEVVAEPEGEPFLQQRRPRRRVEPKRRSSVLTEGPRACPQGRFPRAPGTEPPADPPS
jgi:hypothetical protein